MKIHRIGRGAVGVLAAALLMPACGGGGGGGGATLVLALQALSVTTQAPGPLSPFGTTAGGDTALLTGTGFVAGLSVRFGAVAAAVTQVSANQVRVTTPAGAEGFVTVSVTNPGGASVSLPGVFQYVRPPTVILLEAQSGPTTGENRAPIAGGDLMRIVGTGFRDGVRVDVGTRNVAATRIDDATVEFTVPAVQDEQAVDIVVTNPEGLKTTLVGGLLYTQEFSLVQANDALTQATASHLYRRAGFGAPSAVITDAVNRGLNATVSRLVDFTNDTAVEAAAILLYGQNVPPEANINNVTNQQYWLYLITKNGNPLQERLAWFLHDHFAISGRDFNNDFTWTLKFQVDLLRRCSVARTDTLAGKAGLGYDWRSILVEMAKDRAMLDWLDGRVSTVRSPNENWPRELWELFMLGEGNGYTEADIKEAARAFTGFRWFRTGARTDDDELDIEYRQVDHDATSKTVLGATGLFGYDSISPFHNTSPGLEMDPRDTEGIVSVTLRQRPVECSRFICRKLAEFFLYDDVHDIVVDELAADLRRAGNDQWNLRPIIMKILKSKAMFSSRAIKGKVKGPVEFAVGFLRTTQIDLASVAGTSTRRLYDRLLAMGQVPLDPPDVNGWPRGTAWLAAQSMVERYNFLNFAVQQMDNFATQVDPLLPPPGQRSPAQLVDHIAGILDVQLGGTARTTYINYVNSQLVGDQQVPFTFDPNNSDHLKNKSRGLLWLIGQYHDGHQD